MERIYTIFASNPCTHENPFKGFSHDSIQIFAKRAYLTVGKFDSTRVIKLAFDPFENRNKTIRFLLEHYETIEIVMADHHHYIIER